MPNSDSGQDGVPLIEPTASPKPLKSNTSKKRKLEDENTPGESKKAAKKRQKSSKKPTDVDDNALDVEKGVNHAIAHMDSKLLADHMAQRTKRFQPDLSSVETDEFWIPDRAIKDTTTWRQARSTPDLSAFIELYAAPRRKKKKGPKCSDAAEEKGAPHTLVVAGSGQRAADLTRVLRYFERSKDVHVAKLFAKHIKLQEQVDFLARMRTGVGVGTPQRIIDLIENGALNIEYLERIVIDASHIDQKKRGILDMKETQVPLAQLLARKEIRERYESENEAKKVELLFF